MTKDMSSPNWTRTLARLRRNAAELREHGCQVIEPDGFDTPPSRRLAPSPDRPV